MRVYTQLYICLRSGCKYWHILIGEVRAILIVRPRYILQCLKVKFEKAQNFIDNIASHIKILGIKVLIVSLSFVYQSLRFSL